MQASLNKTEFVNSWFLMSSPMTLAVLLATYLMFVLKIGPRYMKERKPYQFPNGITFYNTVQVMISTYLVYVCGRMLVLNGLIPKTCGMDTEFSRYNVTLAMYYYLLAKISELLDTIFFILRKKEKQVTFLHVYHHTLMVVVTWTALKYEPTIHLLVLGTVNSFVHIIMYTYYGLSAFPGISKYMWWKKYITSLQLVQFVIVMATFARAAVASNCPPSYVLFLALSFNCVLFLYLFGKFYVTSYTKSSLKSDGKSHILVNTLSKGHVKKENKNGSHILNYKDLN